MKFAAIALLTILLTTACKPEKIYTLYRSSTVGDVARVHVATFDVDENEEYNRENCQIAANLFQSQPGVVVKYWCEKGAFKE